MSVLDLENRLGIKDPMHRKKLFLAMSARQVNLLTFNTETVIYVICSVNVITYYSNALTN